MPSETHGKRKLNSEIFHKLRIDGIDSIRLLVRF